MKCVLMVLSLWGNDIDDAEASLNEILARVDAPEEVRAKVTEYLASLKSPFSGPALQAILAGFVAEILSKAPGFNPDAGGLA